ncbi:MAG: hypothetical protein AB4368_22840 [Xenococcaceae cyanobacterium]
MTKISDEIRKTDSQKNFLLSFAVRDKFFLLLLLTLILMFDAIVRQPSSELFKSRSCPEIPVAR